MRSDSHWNAKWRRIHTVALIRRYLCCVFIWWDRYSTSVGLNERDPKEPRAMIKTSLFIDVSFDDWVTGGQRPQRKSEESFRNFVSSVCVLVPKRSRETIRPIRKQLLKVSLQTLVLVYCVYPCLCVCRYLDCYTKAHFVQRRNVLHPKAM